MAISMLKIRRPLGRLIFNMGITIPCKTVFLIETAPLVPSGTKPLPEPVLTVTQDQGCRLPLAQSPMASGIPTGRAQVI